MGRMTPCRVNSLSSSYTSQPSSSVASEDDAVDALPSGPCSSKKRHMFRPHDVIRPTYGREVSSRDEGMELSSQGHINSCLRSSERSSGLSTDSADEQMTFSSLDHQALDEVHSGD